MKWKMEDGAWSPYVAGALVGVLAIASVLATTWWGSKTHLMGASTTFVRGVGLLECAVAPGHVGDSAYYTKTKVSVDWQFLFVTGIFIGALVSSLADKSFKLESCPPTWRSRFGGSVGKRALGALAGGAVAMFGARLAGGCPSGHGLSGLMQLSMSGFVAMAMFFGAGIVVAHVVYKES